MTDGGDDDEGPRPLEYRRPVAGSDRPATPVAVQPMAGAGVWVLVVAAAVGVAQMAHSPPPEWLAVMATVALVGPIGLTVVVRDRFDWRGFLPGVLVGIGLTCLVQVGIIVVLCGPCSR